MLKSSKNIIVIGFSALYSSGIFAANDVQMLTQKDLDAQKTISYVATLGMGAGWQASGKTQTLALTSDIEKTYTANQPKSIFPNYDLFLGVQKKIQSRVIGQFGVDIAAADHAELAGDIWDDASPEFNNYRYQYHIKHSQLALKGKLIGDFDHLVLPWISAAVGIGFNRSFDFSNTPAISQAVASPNFSSHNTRSFTYSIGLGVEHILDKNWQVGMGYEFSDWGRSELGAASGSTTNQTLTLSHLYTQAIMLNISYVS